MIAQHPLQLDRIEVYNCSGADFVSETGYYKVQRDATQKYQHESHVSSTLLVAEFKSLLFFILFIYII